VTQFSDMDGNICSPTIPQFLYMILSYYILTVTRE